MCLNQPHLPNPENGCSDVDRVFVQQMNLNWDESAALMGVHSLGRARDHNSGYDGWWTAGTKAREFSNNYYQSIMTGWKPDKAINNNKFKNQWRRADTTSANSIEKTEMMLNTDLCLFIDAKAQTADNALCLWNDFSFDDPDPRLLRTSTCIGDTNAGTVENCCKGTKGGTMVGGGGRPSLRPLLRSSLRVGPGVFLENRATNLRTGSRETSSTTATLRHTEAGEPGRQRGQRRTAKESKEMVYEAKDEGGHMFAYPASSTTTRALEGWATFLEQVRVKREVKRTRSR